MLVARAVVDVDCHAAQRGDFGGEVREARVVLSGCALVSRMVSGVGIWGVLFALVGLRHCGKS